MARILIVEDEDKMRRVLQRGLSEEGHEVVAVGDGLEGLKLARAGSFDCLILDVMLPGRSGLDVLAELRSVGNRTPTLILSARGETDDRVRGLDCGADDYLTKPFVWAELLARVRACLRRGETSRSDTLRAANIVLLYSERRLTCGEREVELTLREADLLAYLMRRAGRNVSREQLAADVWHDPQSSLTNVIDVYVNYLRKKLDRVGAGGLIETVRGVGYLLKG